MTAQLDAALHSERLERLSGLARNCDQLRGGWKETTSGAKDDRAQRNEVMTLAQARDVDVVLVSELTRQGRSTIDLFHTLGELQAWGIFLITQTGLQFDLGTPRALQAPTRPARQDRSQKKRALELVAAGQSYREVGLRLGISKNTVLDIVKRDRAKQATITG